MTTGWILTKIAECKQIQKDCDDKIARLEPAYKELHSAYEQFKSARKSTTKVFETNGSWRGERYKDFCNAGDELEDLLKAYEDQLDAAQDAINTEIGRLKDKKIEQNPLISGWWGKYYELIATAENVINDYT